MFSLDQLRVLEYPNLLPSHKIVVSPQLYKHYYVVETLRVYEGRDELEKILNSEH